MNIAETRMEATQVFSLAVETDRYLAVSMKLPIEDIDWAQARTVGVTDDEVFMLTYFSDVEYQTIMYMRDLLKTRAAKEPEVLAFLTMWNYEEFFHGKALAQFLKECGRPLSPTRTPEVRRAAQVTEFLESVGASILSRIFAAEFPAVHAAWGATQEITTLHGYQELGKLTNNPVLKVLCDRIAKQERRHFAWYFNSARERLAQSTRAQWLTRQLLTRFWSPVGAGVKTKAEVVKLMSLLFPGDRAFSVGRDIDEKIGELPGLSGIGLMLPYMKKSLAAYRSKSTAA